MGGSGAYQEPLLTEVERSKNADEFTFAKFLSQHLSFFPPISQWGSLALLWHIVFLHCLLFQQKEVSCQWGQGRVENLLPEAAGLDIKLKDSVSQDLASAALHCPCFLSQLYSFILNRV